METDTLPEIGAGMRGRDLNQRKKSYFLQLSILYIGLLTYIEDVSTVLGINLQFFKSTTSEIGLTRLTDLYIGFTLKMESASKNTIFGLKMMKSGLIF